MDEGSVRSLATRFFDVGFFRGDAEYGSECCDQFDDTPTYRDADDERTVTGSDGSLPEEMRELVGDGIAFVQDARGGG